MRQLGFIISLAEFIFERDTNHSSIEIISEETSEYSGRNSRSGWRVLGILRSYRKRFFWGSHTAWRDRAHRNGSLPIECGKHGSKFLFKETGKKDQLLIKDM